MIDQAIEILETEHKPMFSHGVAMRVEFDLFSELNSDLVGFYARAEDPHRDSRCRASKLEMILSVLKTSDLLLPEIDIVHRPLQDDVTIILTSRIRGIELDLLPTTRCTLRVEKIERSSKGFAFADVTFSVVPKR